LRGYEWNGPRTNDRGFENARQRANAMSPGDIVIPYLRKWRFGVPGRIIRKALTNAEWNPTGNSDRDPDKPGLGRRIHVRWLTNGAPPLDKIAVVPRPLRKGHTRGMVASSVESLKPERYNQFMKILRNRENWQPYYFTSGGSRNGSNDSLYPDELPINRDYYEGGVLSVQVNRYERDPIAREACLEEHGANCMVCGLSFNERYGAIGKGFIHVHHLKPLAAMQRKYRINPKTDLVPVCPNCHAMLHRQKPPFSIKQLKAKLRVS
jgi:5-methylcytosine-specific restriction enzyme A